MKKYHLRFYVIKNDVRCQRSCHTMTADKLSKTIDFLKSLDYSCVKRNFFTSKHNEGESYLAYSITELPNL